MATLKEVTILSIFKSQQKNITIVFSTNHSFIVVAVCEESAADFTSCPLCSWARLYLVKM